jgi:hypothetical protein
MNGSEEMDRERAAAEALRGDLFTGLDRLAFALELEAADAVQAGDEAAAARLEDQRLGVRLAQRLVAGVHADEVDLRIERIRHAYDVRTGGAPGPLAASR